MAIQRLPNVEDDASFVRQHPPHLSHRRGAFGKELQSLLAEHEIEGIIRQIERGGIPLPTSHLAQMG